MRGLRVISAIGVLFLFAVQADASDILDSSIPDLNVFSWNNAYCSDCGPAAQDQPLSKFVLSGSASITALNLVTGPIYGDSLYAGLGGFTFEIYNSDHSTIVFSQPLIPSLVTATFFNTDIITASVSGLDLTDGTYWAGFYADVLGLPGFEKGATGLLIETIPHTGTEQFPLEGNIGFQLLGNVSAVPEPATWAMLMVGFAGIGLAGYREKRRYQLPNPAGGVPV